MALSPIRAGEGMGEGEAEETTTAGAEACGLNTQDRRDREEQVRLHKSREAGRGSFVEP